MTDHVWRTAVLVLLAAAVGALLAVAARLPLAEAQSEGSASGVICVVGPERAGDAPVFVVDVPEQTVVAYTYSYSSQELELTSVRTFRYDKRLLDWQTKSPSVGEIRDYVTTPAQNR